MNRNTITQGTFIKPISPNRGIAIFRTEAGSRFIKAKHEEDDWRAITLLTYKGAGLVVFLNDLNELEHIQKMGSGEILKSQFIVRISSVHEKHAIGDIVKSDTPKCKPLTYDPASALFLNFEDLFNELCVKIDEEYDDAAPLSSVSFENILFAPDECATILRLQKNLFRILGHETRNVGVGSSDFETGNSSKNDF